MARRKTTDQPTETVPEAEPAAAFEADLPEYASRAMSRADVIRRTWTEYAAGRITLTEALAAVAQWRPRR